MLIDGWYFPSGFGCQLKKVSSTVAEAEISFYSEVGFCLPLSHAATGSQTWKCHLSGCKANGILSLLISAKGLKPDVRQDRDGEKIQPNSQLCLIFRSWSRLILVLSSFIPKTLTFEIFPWFPSYLSPHSVQSKGEFKTSHFSSVHLKIKAKHCCTVALRFITWLFRKGHKLPQCARYEFLWTAHRITCWASSHRLHCF